MRIDPVPTGVSYVNLASNDPLVADQIPPEAPGVPSHTPTDEERDEIDHGGGSRFGPNTGGGIDHGTTDDVTRPDLEQPRVGGKFAAKSAAEAASPESEGGSEEESATVSEVPDGEQAGS